MSVPGGSNVQELYDRLILHDSRREGAPEGFVLHNYLDKEVINLRINLRGRDTPGLVNRLYEVSTPGSPSYGQFLSKEEAESYTRPPQKVVDEIQKWLDNVKVPFKFISPSNNRLQITLPASQANKMFHAKFSTYYHKETGTTSYQTLHYSLPSLVKDVIESIEPTTSFPNLPPRRRASSLNDPIDDIITPSVLTMLYGIPTAEVTQAGNLLSVVGFSAGDGLNQYANRSDLNLFLGKYRPDLVTSTRAATFTDQSVDGGQNIQRAEDSGEEANLDIQYTVGLVNFAKVEYTISGKADIDGWIDIVDYWLKQDNLPTVVSISYGGPEGGWVTKTSATPLSNRFAELGSRGVSILVSTGDYGVDCTVTNDPPYKKFVPTFPASCPYVTAVGATRGNPEVASTLSGGGFSTFFARDEAPYQKDAVDGYLDQIGSLYDGAFKRSGRAYPDISAQGDWANVVIVNNGQIKRTGGTSAATPINASIVTLLNDRLLRQKGRSLGFLNPLLYANPTILNNITEGSNPGYGTDGFPAKSGWDPVTGLGTPNFAKMEKLILSPSISNGDKRRDLWVKDPDGNMTPIVPGGASIVLNNMMASNYEIASAKSEAFSQAPPLLPPGTGPCVTNVGRGNLVFVCPWNADETFILPNGTRKALAEVDYVVYTINDY